MARTRWILVDTVRSDSEPGKPHKIERHPVTGSLRCDCGSFIFSHAPKSCKHLRARAAREAGFGWPTSATAPPAEERASVQVRLDNETYTVEAVRAVRIGGWGKGA